MRLTAFEIKAIKQNATTIFGDAAKVFLFGSRVDDSKKGGDIDLYVLIYAKKEVIEGIYLTLKATCHATAQSL